jgi:methionyl-tRNA formyltransferase
VFTEIKKDGKPLRLKLLAIKPTERPSKPHAPGAFITEKNSIFVATGTTLIELQELQLEGKKSLTSAQFINGFGHYLTA